MWSRFDDGFHDNPKILDAGNAGAGLYARSVTYSARSPHGPPTDPGRARRPGAPGTPADARPAPDACGTHRRAPSDPERAAARRPGRRPTGVRTLAARDGQTPGDARRPPRARDPRRA